jgi:hypothetical protein
MNQRNARVDCFGVIWTGKLLGYRFRMVVAWQLSSDLYRYSVGVSVRRTSSKLIQYYTKYRSRNVSVDHRSDRIVIAILTTQALTITGTYLSTARYPYPRFSTSRLERRHQRCERADRRSIDLILPSHQTMESSLIDGFVS